MLQPHATTICNKKINGPKELTEDQRCFYFPTHPRFVSSLPNLIDVNMLYFHDIRGPFNRVSIHSLHEFPQTINFNQ